MRSVYALLVIALLIIVLIIVQYHKKERFMTWTEGFTYLGWGLLLVVLILGGFPLIGALAV
jgi:heme A synthase